MKRIITEKILVAILLLTMTVACEDTTFLDTDVNGQFTSESFWQTEEHALLGINGTYNTLLDIYNSAAVYYENQTDNGFNEQGGLSVLPFYDFNPSSGGIINSRYSQCYEGIGRANTVLARVPDIEIDAGLKSRILGEAHFLRALFYHQLADNYGGVPILLNEPDISTDGDMARDSKENVIAQILADLDAAAAALPQSYNSDNTGRATWGAAMALKARVLLFEGRWGEASQVANQIIQSGNYSIYQGGFREMFLPANENNSEVIFDVQYGGNNKSSFDEVLFQFDGAPVLRNFVDAFDMTNGLPITDPASGYDSDNPLVGRDPRLLQTVAAVGTNLNGEVVTIGQYGRTGFGFKKYQSYTDNETIPLFGSNESETNYIVIRYADVLLMFAEAENEANGPSTAVFDALDEIRTRTSVNMPVVDRTLSQSELRNFIRKERRLELAMEGIRMSDIRRWGIGEQVLNGAVFLRIDGNGDSVIVNREFDASKHNVWPIPQSEIELNPNLTQNPNY